MSQFEILIKQAGGDSSYTIIENEGHFGVEQDGKLIAVIQCNEDWEQVSGDALPDDVLNAIIDQIESKYE